VRGSSKSKKANLSPGLLKHNNKTCGRR